MTAYKSKNAKKANESSKGKETAEGDSRII